jgi:adenylosuccinate lyase
MTGLARLVRGYALSAMENIALWHERDISHSSVERVIAPDSTILVDFMLTRMTGLISGLVVYPKNMKKNLDSLKGLIFSQKVLLKLAASGLSREDAYEVVQRNAMKVWEGGDKDLDFKGLLLKDKAVTSKLKPKEIEACFALKPYLKHVDYIFKRVFK